MACQLAIAGVDDRFTELLLEYLTGRDLELTALRLLVTDPYEADPLTFGKQSVVPEALADTDFTGIDILLLGPDPAVRPLCLEPAAAAGTRVVDCGLSENLPETPHIMVPEIAPDADMTDTLVANPQPVSTVLALLLNPVMEHSGLEQVIASCLLPASLRGKAAVEDLAGETARLLNGLPVKDSAFGQQLAFNIHGETSAITEGGYTEEELKITRELHQLLNAPQLAVDVTCLQAPVFFATSLTLTLTLDRAASPEQIARLLQQTPGVKVVKQGKAAPTAVKQAADSDEIFVGRIRQSPQNDRQITLWAVVDTDRKGLVLNAVQIVEKLIKSHSD